MSDILQQDIRYLKGVGERRAQLLQRLGISSVDALLRHYPHRYEDWSDPVDIFSDNLAISFKGYPLFETLSNYKYSVKKMKRFWKVSLKTISKLPITGSTTSKGKGLKNGKIQ